MRAGRSSLRGGEGGREEEEEERQKQAVAEGAATCQELRYQQPAPTEPNSTVERRKRDEVTRYGHSIADRRKSSSSSGGGGGGTEHKLRSVRTTLPQLFNY